MRDDHARLLDMLEAIEKIERYSGIDKSDYEHDELIQVWMVYNVQIIGEAVSQLSEGFRTQHPEVPWRAIAAMRHAIVHGYFRVDHDEVWNVVQKDVPKLKEAIQMILDQ